MDFNTDLVRWTSTSEVYDSPSLVWQEHPGQEVVVWRWTGTSIVYCSRYIWAWAPYQGQRWISRQILVHTYNCTTLDWNCKANRGTVVDALFYIRPEGGWPFCLACKCGHKVSSQLYPWQWNMDLMCFWNTWLMRCFVGDNRDIFPGCEISNTVPDQDGDTWWFLWSRWYKCKIHLLALCVMLSCKGCGIQMCWHWYYYHGNTKTNTVPTCWIVWPANNSVLDSSCSIAEKKHWQAKLCAFLVLSLWSGSWGLLQSFRPWRPSWWT